MGDGEGEPADRARMGVTLGRILWMDGGGVLASSGPPAMNFTLRPEDLLNDSDTQAVLCATDHASVNASGAECRRCLHIFSVVAACKACCCIISGWATCRIPADAQRDGRGVPGMRARRGVPSVPGSAGAQRGGSSGGTTMSCSDSSSSRSGLGWRPSTSGALSTCAPSDVFHIILFHPLRIPCDAGPKLVSSGWDSQTSQGMTALAPAA